MNHIVLLGRACADPNIRFSATGTSLARFTLAVDRRYNKQQKEQLQKDGKPTSDFIRIVVWGNTAEHAERYLRKGARVIVNGTLVLGKYEKEGGETVYYTEVHADRLKVIDYLERKDNFQDDELGDLTTSQPGDEKPLNDMDPIVSNSPEETIILDEGDCHLYEA